MKCYKCGAEMVEDAVFCGICGTRLKEVPTEMAEESIEAEAADWDVAEEWEPAADWDEKEEWEILSMEEAREPGSGSSDMQREGAADTRELRHCPNCGKQLAKEMAFCNECGCRISDGAKAQEGKKDDWKNLAPAILIGAAIIGIIIAVILIL